MVIIVSTLSANSAKPRSAIDLRWPLQKKRTVTTATVRAPSRGRFPPRPAPRRCRCPAQAASDKTISEPFRISRISFCDSSAACRPNSGFIPAPKPRVTDFPICNYRRPCCNASLHISIDRNKIHPANSFFDHALNRAATAAATPTTLILAMFRLCFIWPYNFSEKNFENFFYL